jgi:hypothetical protein
MSRGQKDHVFDPWYKIFCFYEGAHANFTTRYFWTKILVYAAWSWQHIFLTSVHPMKLVFRWNFLLTAKCSDRLAEKNGRYVTCRCIIFSKCIPHHKIRAWTTDTIFLRALLADPSLGTWVHAKLHTRAYTFVGRILAYAEKIGRGSKRSKDGRRIRSHRACQFCFDKN